MHLFPVQYFTTKWVLGEWEVPYPILEWLGKVIRPINESLASYSTQVRYGYNYFHSGTSEEVVI